MRSRVESRYKKEQRQAEAETKVCRDGVVQIRKGAETGCTRDKGVQRQSSADKKRSRDRLKQRHRGAETE